MNKQALIPKRAQQDIIPDKKVYCEENDLRQDEVITAEGKEKAKKKN